MKFIKKLTFLLILLLSFFSIFSYQMTSESFEYFVHGLKLNDNYICYNTGNGNTTLYTTTKMLGCILSENQNYKVRNWLIGGRCGLSYNDDNEKLTANFDLDGFNGLIVKNLKKWERNDILNANLWMKVYLYYSLVDEDGTKKQEKQKEFLIDDDGLTKEEILSKISKSDFNNIDNTQNYNLSVSYTIEDGKCPISSIDPSKYIEGIKIKNPLFTIKDYIKSKCKIDRDNTDGGENYKYKVGSDKVQIEYKIDNVKKKINYKLDETEHLTSDLIMSLMPDDYFVKKRFSGNKNIEYSIKVNSNECTNTADDNFDYYFLDLNLDLPREIILNL